LVVIDTPQNFKAHERVTLSEVFVHLFVISSKSYTYCYVFTTLLTVDVNVFSSCRQKTLYNKRVEQWSILSSQTMDNMLFS